MHYYFFPRIDSQIKVVIDQICVLFDLWLKLVFSIQNEINTNIYKNSIKKIYLQNFYNFHVTKRENFGGKTLYGNI